VPHRARTITNSNMTTAVATAATPRVDRVLKVDRSRIVARQECPRLRYLAYHFGHTGLEPRTARMPLVAGIHYHQALAEICSGRHVELAVASAIVKFQAEVIERGLATVSEEDLQFVLDEQTALLEGMVRGWHHVRYPRLLDEYDIFDVEREFEFEPEPGFVLMQRFDFVVRHRTTRRLRIGDFKGLAFVGDDWSKKQQHDAQWKLTLEGAEAHYGEPVDGVIVEGLIKGYRRKETAKASPWFGRKLQQSPYCYGYTDGTDFQAGYTSRKGWYKTPVWEVMTPKEWFDRVLTDPNGDFNLADQFVVEPDICPPRHERRRWLRQAIHQELLWAETCEQLKRAQLDMDEDAFSDLLDLLAPQHDNRCVKFGWDNRCPFLESVCFNEGALADPVGTGEFVPRVPHHEGELED